MKDYYKFEYNPLTLIPPFEHKEPEDDDCGLPEHPIFSNYSGNIWTSLLLTGGAEIGVTPRTKTAKEMSKPIPSA